MKCKNHTGLCGICGWMRFLYTKTWEDSHCSFSVCDFLHKVNYGIITKCGVGFYECTHLLLMK